jgi:hypothetical protein
VDVCPNGFVEGGLVGVFVDYLKADVRRNGRNGAGREVTLPWFREEGSQLSQLGGYRNTFLENFVQPNFGQNFK